ncbi:MAG: ATP-grasp domain-containing protein [Candidatus Gracilibacteria bacterium]
MNYLTISPATIIKRAQATGYTLQMIDEKKSTYILSKDGKEVIFKGCSLDNSSSMSKICNDKLLTYQVLNHWKYPTIQSNIYSIDSLDEVEQIIAASPTTIVIKPVDSAHGNGVHVWNNTQTLEVLRLFIADAVSFTRNKKNFLIQEFIEGEDYRFFILFGKCHWVTHRIKPYVIGDGKKTINELIETLNDDPNRGAVLYTEFYNKVLLTEELDILLSEQGVTRESILPKGKKIFLSYKCNNSVGGTEKIITDKIDPKIAKVFEDLAIRMGLEIVGIDVLHADLKNCKSINEIKIIELNATPGIQTPIESVNDSTVDVILKNKFNF